MTIGIYPLQIEAAAPDPTLAPEKLFTPENIPYFRFDGSTIVEKIYWNIQLPPSYATPGTAPVLRIQWSSATTSTADCVWQCAVHKITPNSDTDDGTATRTAFATANTVTDAGVGTRQIQSTTMTMTNMDGAVAGDNVLFKFFRDGAHASDTMNSVDAVLYLVDFEFTES